MTYTITVQYIGMRGPTGLNPTGSRGEECSYRTMRTDGNIKREI
jgi:hypothetical protein